MLAPILQEYGIDRHDFTEKVFGNGLINRTWKIHSSAGNYILQKINQQVFRNPRFIASNINRIGEYLTKYYPEYLFTEPLLSLKGEPMVCLEGECYRLFHFIKGSHSIDVVSEQQQAYEAARQFGKFAKLLAGMDTGLLQITLPGFHNLMLRYKQFEEALENGNSTRITECRNIIEFIRQHKQIAVDFSHIRSNPAFKLRVTHHDTKISNILFDDDNKGLCVIDLDTVMPGYFISDVGDMLRTYLSPASEEEKDYDRIVIRTDFFRAIMEGYLAEMKEELSDEEILHFTYGGKFMIYMQALRFLTDYLNNDAYYAPAYEGHNLVRATNQTVLLQRFIEKEDAFKQMVLEYSGIIM